MPGLFENYMSGSSPDLGDAQIVNESSCRSRRSREQLWSRRRILSRAPAEADLPNRFTDCQLPRYFEGEVRGFAFAWKA